LNLPFETETIVTEADVELKVIAPLLTDGNFLAIPSASIKGKAYLAPTVLDKSPARPAAITPIRPSGNWASPSAARRRVIE
jgi:hypothetical protein